MREQGYILPKSYRNIALGFFILSILIFVSISYSIWARVTITIIPNTENVSQEFVFKVKPGLVEPSQDAIAGRLGSMEVEGSANFVATGSENMKTEVVGEVTIINNYSQEQTLVETTRLATPENPDQVLVRLKKTVTIPAGGQIKVQVYPEDPDNFTKIEPRRFIIPGLWQPLWEKIYAENSENLEAGGTVTIVIQEDLDQAKKSLEEQLYQKSLAEIDRQLDTKESLWPKLVSIKVSEINYDVEVGQEASEFTATMKLKATVVVFDESQLISLARDKMKIVMPSGKQLVDLDPKSFSYAVESYDLDAKEATVKVSFIGSSIIGNMSEFLDKSELGGLTEEEVKEYFSQFSEIQSVEVKFQPSWLKKTPRFGEKINVVVSSGE